MRARLILLVLVSGCTSARPDTAPGAEQRSPHAEVLAKAPPAAPADAPIGGSSGVPDAGPKAALSPPEPRADIKADINARFLDPDLDVERWTRTFEGESRETYAARHEVVRALQLSPGQSVADIGAGSGFYLWAFAEAVGPTGQVYGVEIAPRFLERLRKHVREEKVENAAIVTGTTRSVQLAEGSVDLVFICDTYHHFEYPQTTLASIRRALRPGGALVIIDFKRVEGKTANWILEHVRAGQEVFRREIEAAGFVFDRELDISGFSENYMMRFTTGE